MRFPPNSGSLTITLLAAAYPVFVTVIVYVTLSPAEETVVGIADFVISYNPPDGITISTSTVSVAISVSVGFPAGFVPWTETVLSMSPSPSIFPLLSIPLPSIAFCGVL